MSQTKGSDATRKMYQEYLYREIKEEMARRAAIRSGKKEKKK